MNYVLRKATIILFSIVNSLLLYGQTEFLPFNNYTNVDGFDSQVINAIGQDADGNIWIGSFSGLSKCDGSNTMIFAHDPNDPHSLPDNAVNAIFTDSKRRTWIGSRAGLALLQPGDNSFKVFLSNKK